MRRSLLAGLALFGASVQAWGCLSDADAQSIADRSAIFLSHTNITLANETAQGLFATNIQEFSDSVNSLRSQPLGTQVENGVQGYIADTLASPVIPNITTLAIVHDCNQMVWQWEFNGIGSGMNRVRGMTLITVDNSSKVTNQYVEFNSLAWGADIGFNITPVAIP